MKRITRLPPLPLRPANGHKGLFGRVLIVGGSDSMPGAPALAGIAALRMGSGLVQLASPSASLAFAPELIGVDDFDAAIEVADAIVVGPGLGQSSAARKRVLKLICINKPMVIDADAINILAAEKTWPKSFSARAVLTPHPGEMKRLTRHLKGDDPAKAAITLGQIIVLKGHRTVVTDGTHTYINATGDTSLSKAGTGDVLSGMIGSLIGQKMKPFDAAVAATWIHGKAGELAGKQLGRRCVLRAMSSMRFQRRSLLIQQQVPDDRNRHE